MTFHTVHSRERIVVGEIFENLNIFDTRSNRVKLRSEGERRISVTGKYHHIFGVYQTEAILNGTFFL